MSGFAIWAGTSFGFAVLAGLALAGGWLALRMAGVRRWTTLPDLLVAVAFVGILVLTLRTGRFGQPTGELELVPFDDLLSALPDGPRQILLAVTDLVTNVILFVPFGSAIALRWPRLGAGRALVASAGLSLLVETVQWLAPIGRTAQVTDVLMNVLGGWLGWLLVDRLRRSEALNAAVRRRR
jgi:glycopeptide antibiotics resistance protein